MAFDPEYKEFFLRDTKVTTGTKPDQESNYPTTIKVNGVSKGNRFLKGHFPSESVIKKLFNSIGFKLNKEDTASTTVQGLVKKSSDTDAKNRLLNPSSDFTLGVTPHQLPELVLSTDVNDAADGAAVEAGGLKLTKITRTLSGLFRRNYLIELNRNHSLVISSNKIQLDGDAAAPGNSMHYGTNGAGTKGWYADAIVPYSQTKRLDVDSPHASATTSIITGGDQFRLDIPAAGKYKFKAWMPVLLDNANGGRFNLQFSAAITTVVYSIKYTDTASKAIQYIAKKVALAGNDNFDTFTAGYVEIEGTIHTNAAGLLTLEAGSKNGLAGVSMIEAGSYFRADEIR